MNRVFGHRGPVFVIVLGVVAAALVAGCKPHTRDNPDVCDPTPGSTDGCASGLKCNEDYRCVSMGSGGEVGTLGTGGSVVSTGGAGGPSSGGKGGKGGSGGTVATAGAGGHAAAGVGGKAGGAGGAPECDTTGNKDCSDSKKSVCLSGKCVECKNDGQCKGTMPICSPQNTCVSCKDKDVDAEAYKSRAGTPFCATSGSSAGACVECDTSMNCSGLKPLCSLNNCVGCVDVGPDMAGRDMACMMATNKQLPVCVMTGSQAGACVECGKDADCSTDPNKPFCSPTGTCMGCGSVAKEVGCITRVPGKPVCGPAGACVQCVANLDCDSKTPVCAGGNTCGPCSGDNDCGGRYGPTVCMPKDGHCAIDDETIYVQSKTGCSDSSTTAGGTAMVPYCSLQMVPAAVSGTRNLVVVRGSVNNSPTPFGGGATQLWIVGQQLALIGGVNVGIRLTAGEATIRDLAISNSPTVGIQADTGSTLHLQHVNVSNNSGGGILLDGAAFDIQNTTVKNNGPGDMMGTAWGGIRIASPPTGLKQLQNVTVQANNGGGVSCTAQVQGTGVLASDNTNTPNQIAPSCMITSCGAPGATCGAQ